MSEPDPMTLEEHMALNPHPSPPAPVPLIYDDTVSTASIQKVLFVNSGAVPLETHANATTFPIVYDSSSALEDILEVMRRKFSVGSVLSRIGFAFHNHGDLTSFVNREAWFSDSDLDDNQTVFSQNAQFMLDFLREFKVTHVDFLACKTLQSEKWRKYYQLIQTQTGVIVGASDDDTGNVKYGGDWVLESTMEDIRDVYFTSAIENYASLLLAPGMTIIANVGKYNSCLTILGDFMYTFAGTKIFKIDLRTNVVSDFYDFGTTVPNLEAWTQGIRGMCAHGAFLYFTWGQNSTSNSIGKINLSDGTLVSKTWVTGILNPWDVITDGTNLYVPSLQNNGIIYKIPLSYTGAVTNAHKLTSLSYPNRLFIYNNELYAIYENSYLTKFTNISAATATWSSAFGSKLIQNGYGSTICITNSGKVFLGQYSPSQANVPQGIIQMNLAGSVVNSSFFVNAESPVAPETGYYTNITDMVEYNNKLYCASYNYGYVFSVDLTASPVITVQPTASNSITYPAIMGSVTLTGGTALTAIGGTAVPGTFIISTAVSNTVYSAGTYTNVVPVTFIPTDTNTYSSVSTTVQSVTVVAPAIPYISTRPTAATSLTYPATLATVSLTGGAALSAIGGTAVPGTFSINNPTTVLNAGTYTDISATFLPTDTTAYSSVSTSVPSITVLKGTPYLAARPSSATLMYPNKLGAMTITGGSCTVSNGGATIPGTFTIHPDLSNSVFAVGTYQDVSAVFIPTASTNYNQVATTIQALTVTQPSTAQLASIGVSATELKTAGFNATELKTAGFTVTQQKAAGYSAAQMKTAGYDVSALYQVFTTTTEKKSVTKAVVSDILASTAKTTVALSTLVGYTFNPLVTSAIAVKVTDVNTPITVSRSELQSGTAAVYAVLDVVSSYIVIPTWSSSIRVMYIGNDLYRIYDSKGTTILYNNLVLGDTRTHDGITVVIGSVTATYTPPPNVNFVLSGLNSSFTLSSSGEIPNYQPTSLVTDATITLDYSVSASDLQKTFFYRTDNPITTDASFVYYYVDTTKWSNQSTTLNPKNGIVTDGGYVANDPGSKDFLRDLARQLFGTYLAADLFTNEDAVITDIHAKFDTVATNVVALLTSIDKTNGTLSGMSADEFGKKYLKDNTTTSNISRELLNQLITSAPARFVDISNNSIYNTVEDGFYKIPFLSGDKISFKVTISPSTGQLVAVPTGLTAMTSRSYTIILNVT